MKKLFAAILTVAMLAGLLAACGPVPTDPPLTVPTVPTTTLPPVEEREVIDITLAVNTQTPDAEATHLHAYILENFKINLVVTQYNSENRKEQLTLMLAEDNLPDLMAFADKLEKATIDTIESGIMTKDLALLYEGEAKVLNSEQFLDAIASRM